MTLQAIGKGNLINGWTILERLHEIEFQPKEYPQGSGPDRTTTRLYECPTCHRERTEGHQEDCVISLLIREHEARQ